MIKGLHRGLILLSLGVHAAVVFRETEREPMKIPIRMAKNEGRVRVEMTKPRKKASGQEGEKETCPQDSSKKGCKTPTTG